MILKSWLWLSSENTHVNKFTTMPFVFQEKWRKRAEFVIKAAYNSNFICDTNERYHWRLLYIIIWLFFLPTQCSWHVQNKKRFSKKSFSDKNTSNHVDSFCVIGLTWMWFKFCFKKLMNTHKKLFSCRLISKFLESQTFTYFRLFLYPRGFLCAQINIITS